MAVWYVACHLLVGRIWGWRRRPNKKPMPVSVGEAFQTQRTTHERVGYRARLASNTTGMTLGVAVHQDIGTTGTLRTVLEPRGPSGGGGGGRLSRCPRVLLLPLGVPPTRRHAPDIIRPKTAEFGGCSPPAAAAADAGSAPRGSGGSGSLGSTRRWCAACAGVLPLHSGEGGGGGTPCVCGDPARPPPPEYSATTREMRVGLHTGCHIRSVCTALITAHPTLPQTPS